MARSKLGPLSTRSPKSVLPFQSPSLEKDNPIFWCPLVLWSNLSRERDSPHPPFKLSNPTRIPSSNVPPFAPISSRVRWILAPFYAGPQIQSESRVSRASSIWLLLGDPTPWPTARPPINLTPSWNWNVSLALMAVSCRYVNSGDELLLLHGATITLRAITTTPTTAIVWLVTTHAVDSASSVLWNINMDIGKMLGLISTESTSWGVLWLIETWIYWKGLRDVGKRVGFVVGNVHTKSVTLESIKLLLMSWPDVAVFHKMDGHLMCLSVRLVVFIKTGTSSDWAQWEKLESLASFSWLSKRAFIMGVRSELCRGTIHELI